MFCPNCGSKVNDDDLFCGECGTPLAEYREDVDVKADGPETEQKTEPGTEPETEPVQMQAEESSAGDIPAGEPAAQGFPAGDPLMQGVPAQGSYVRQKKPLSRQATALLVEALAGAALLAGLVFALNAKFSPEKVALRYWEAVMDCEWGEAASYCSFPDDAMLTDQTYADAHALQTEKTDYHAAGITEQMMQQEGDMRTYTVEYLLPGSTDKSYDQIQLVKDGNKFLFWSDWKVVPGDSLAQNYVITAPAGAKVTLNGKEAAKENVTEDEYGQTITFPYLFAGTYQLEVTAEGMNPYRELLNVMSGSGSSTSVTLVPSKEAREEVAQQYADDLKTVLDKAAAGAPFSEVEDVFSSQAVSDNYTENAYEKLCDVFADGEIVSYTISDIEVTVQDGLAYTDTVSLDVEMQYEKTYQSFWTNRQETSDWTLYEYVSYTNEDGEWKLNDIPIYSYEL